jgi:hypothetical protein
MIIFSSVFPSSSSLHWHFRPIYSVGISLIGDSLVSDWLSYMREVCEYHYVSEIEIGFLRNCVKRLIVE